MNSGLSSFGRTHKFGETSDREGRGDMASFVENLQLDERRRVIGVEMLLLRRVPCEDIWRGWVLSRRSSFMGDVDDLVAQEFG